KVRQARVYEERCDVVGGGPLIRKVRLDFAQHLIEPAAPHGRVELGEILVVKGSPLNVGLAEAVLDRTAVVERAEVPDGFRCGVGAGTHEAPILHESLQDRGLSTAE